MKRKALAGWVGAAAYGVLVLFAGACAKPAGTPVKSEAQAVARQLRDLPTPLPGGGPSNGIMPPIEQRRRELYERLRQLEGDGVAALSLALGDQDVQLRKNAALALSVLGGGWFDSTRPKLNLRSGLPALVAALRDSDGDVRGWSAQAIGSIGADGVQAVPALITLLGNAEEGSRNSACIALRGIGPAAKDALPALRAHLNDPQPDVRRFAAYAIDAISRPRESAGGPRPPDCFFRENGFRSGVNAPREVHRVEPDLSGLPPLATEQIAIVEVRIDATGRVMEDCLRRGVRADVDQRVLEAVREWRFEPPRLLEAAQVNGSRLGAGTAVPIFMTVTVRLGASFVSAFCLLPSAFTGSCQTPARCPPARP